MKNILGLIIVTVGSYILRFGFCLLDNNLKDELSNKILDKAETVKDMYEPCYNHRVRT